MRKRTKRLLSFVTALAMSASAFAGMAIHVSAAETQIGSTYDFEETTLNSSWESAKNQLTVAVVDNTALNSKVLNATAGGTGGRTGTLTLPSAITPEGNNPVKVEFDWYSETSPTTCSTDIILVDGNNQICKVSELGSGAISLNGTATELKRGWYKVSAVLDFETHRVISLSLTANGASESAVTVKDMAFINAAATKITGLYVVGNRASGATLAVNVSIDNISAYSVTDEYHKVTLSVKTKSGEAVEGADVTFGGTKYITNASGVIETKLASGEYAYTVTKAGYEADEGEGNNATGTVTVENEAITENIVYSPQTYTPVPETVTMTGGQAVMTAPRTADSVSATAYTVEVIDQKGVAITDADVAWTIMPTGATEADANVTIANGIVSVAKGFDAGATHVKNFTVTATATKNGTSKPATATMSISDYLFYEPGVGGSSYGTVEANANGDNSYISTPSARDGVNVITLPEPIVFSSGTAQLLTFNTTVTVQNAYTYKRNIEFADSEGNVIADIGYINLDVGNAVTGTWNSSSCSFADTWGSIPALGTWQNVSILFKTNANGVTKATITIGDKETDLGTLTASNLAKISLKTSLNSSGRHALLKDIVVNTVDVNGIDIEGEKEFSTIPGVNVTKEYAVDAMVIQDGETFTWTTDIAGATITPSADTKTATLTVPGTVTAGGKVTVVSSESDAKKAELTVNVAAAEVKSANINGVLAINFAAGATEQYTVSDVTDQFGADITKYVTPVWTIDGKTAPDAEMTFNIPADKAGAAVKVEAVYNSDNTLKSVKTTPVTLTAGENKISAEAGAVVMLWDSVNGMVPAAAKQTAPETTDPNVTADTVATITSGGLLKVYKAGSATVTATLLGKPFTQDVKIATYSIVEDYTAGKTTVDISSLVTDNAISGYKVTVADANGNMLAQDNAEAVDNAVAIPEVVVDVVPAKIEVAPIFVFTEGLSDIKASPATLQIPNGKYDIDFLKVTTGRVDLKVNGYIVIENAGQSGNGRGVSGARTYSVDNVLVNQGKAVISGDEKCELTSVTVCKTPEIVTRKTHIWIAGDSTVCVYYGNEETGDVKDMQTGWGQVFDTYLDDSVTVVDLAESGSSVHRWFGEEYPTVRDMAQPGDYFIIQMGINDRSHPEFTSEADMKALLGQMVDEVRERGVIPVLVTPQKSKGYAWYSADASKGDITTWNGAGISWSSYSWGTGVMKTVAEEKGTLFVDSASMSAEAFFNLGADYVIENFHLSNEHATGKEMHFSYAGAQKLASMIAQSIYDQTKAGTATSRGEKFDGIPVVTNDGFTFVDSTGTSQTYKVVASTN